VRRRWRDLDVLFVFGVPKRVKLHSSGLAHRKRDTWCGAVECRSPQGEEMKPVHQILSPAGAAMLSRRQQKTTAGADVVRP
jgi:hypothetical protein